MNYYPSTVMILPRYENFSGSYMAYLFKSEIMAIQEGYCRTRYHDQYGWTIWKYMPEWLGIDRKDYRLDYAVVLSK